MEFKLPEIEEKVLKHWADKDIFPKSVKKTAPKGNFVFFEGPPTANGRPGIHHLVARAFKDIICRYKTMQGYRVTRKAGWDTHGLPVEIEVEKKLGIQHKTEIEKYGIAKFNKLCKESVWQYKEEWTKFTNRIGYWLDLENPYITYQNNYIESVWWLLSQIYAKGWLYKDYRVAPYCPRCGTSLSSHEVSQGYQTVKDNSIYVKFKIISPTSDFEDTSLLVWTTTPWTLPANVAIALNSNLKYAKIRIADSESIIIAKPCLEKIGFSQKIEREFLGKELIGLKYQAPFAVDLKKYPNNDLYQVVAGDFVSDTDGTGFVHIAPAFGEDDMNLVKTLRENKIANFPVIKTVNLQGEVDMSGFAWDKMFVKKADKFIVEHLKEKNILFKEEQYEHEYPFCWRCKSPLLYYALDSWFIKTRAVQKEMIANNQKITWVPEHIKNGRFGVWLKEVKDWNLSRNRFWGTPLPVWQCSNKDCQHQEIIGSIKDLLAKNYSNNNFYLMRHGISECFQENVNVCYPLVNKCPLTKEGNKGVIESAQNFKKKVKEIDYIFCSDMLRTKQTAQEVAKVFGIKESEIIFEPRLRELNVGDFNNQKCAVAGEFYYNQQDPFRTKAPNGESYLDATIRAHEFIAEINQKHAGKNILIITHEVIVSILEKTMQAKDLEIGLMERKQNREARIKPAEVRRIDIKFLPFDENFKIDLHRPYIDNVEFKCPKCCSTMKRTPELIDCWFDSGSMPFAQYHYPFENKQLIDKKQQFPADYISEGVDQTRGWFYTLLAISTLLGKGPSYKSCVSLGHVLDEKGEKMSKSKGNIVNPWDMIEKYGVDAVRWYFYTINSPGESKLFNEKDVDQVMKRFVMIFWNCYVFFATYGVKVGKLSKPKAKNVLDKWILSRLNSVIQSVTGNLDKLEITEAARTIESFLVNDLSLWYVRRSRKKFQQPNNKKELLESSKMMVYVFDCLAKLCAPFVPFFAEEIYLNLLQFQGGKKTESIHLTAWPKVDKKAIDKKLEKQMQETRQTLAAALAIRAKEGLKVRQPLAELFITAKDLLKQKELMALIKEEINVKKISSGKELKFDLNITPELKKEGILREIIRNIQEARKEKDLKPQDKILVSYFGASNICDIINGNKTFMLKEGRIGKLEFDVKVAEIADCKEIKFENDIIKIAIKKI